MPALFKRKKMGYPWDILYWDDVEQNGAIFNYADYIGTDMYDFTERFMTCGIRDWMDGWHAQYTNGPCDWVFDECEKEFGAYKKMDKNNPKHYFRPDEARWIGQAYMVIRHYTSLSSAEIFKIADLDQMRQWYYFGHEVSWDNFIDTVVPPDETE